MSDNFTYDPKRGLSDFDRILLKGAASRKSYTEIAAIVNGVITPAEVGARVQEILDGRDALSQAELRLLAIDDLMAVKDSLMSKAVDYGSTDHAKILVPLLLNLTKLLSESKIDVQKQMEEITRGHAQIMLRAISMALELSMERLEAEHPDIAKGELQAVFQATMPEVIREIESKVARE